MTTFESRESLPLAAAMADDSMDMTSDYEPLGGEDDIDIDIDLTTGHEEDDQMVDDHRSDVDIHDAEDDMGDDLMIDDEQNTLDAMEETNNNATIEVEDVYIDDAVSLENAEPEHTSADAATYTETIQDEGIPDVGDKPEVGWDEKVTDTIAEDAENKYQESQEPVDVSDETETINQGSHFEQSENTEDLTTSAFPAAPKELSQRKVADVSAEEEPAPVDESGAEEQPQSSQADEGKQVVSESPVVVSAQSIQARVFYNDDTYSLIASTEDENPNSYFFSDDAITRQPLSTFFGGLRDVLQGDLSDDDELILASDGLAIEVSETTASLYDFTFADMVNLRITLLTNEEVSEIQPLFISVLVKLNAAKRFRYLSDSAAAGKGFSDVAYWENAESLDDQDEASSFAEETETGVDQPGVLEENEERAEPTTDMAEKPVDDETTTGTKADATVMSAEVGGEKENDVVPIEHQSAVPDAAESPVAGSGERTNDSPADKQAAHGDFGQEKPSRTAEETTEDILDYSEDEDEHSEHRLFEGSLDVEAGDNQSGVDEPAEDPTAASGIHDQTYPLGDYEDNEAIANEPEFQEAIQDGVQIRSDNEEEGTENLQDDQKHEDVEASQDIPDDQDDIDFSVGAPEHTNSATELQALQDDQNSPIEHKVADDGIDFGLSAPDGESNESEPTLAGDEAAVEQHDDGEESEIDYDDDDKADGIDLASEDAPTKRSHAELEDDVDLQEQENKRLRS